MTDKEKNEAIYESLKNQLGTIDLDKIEFSDNDSSPSSKVVEQQKVYFWIRLYLRDECKELESGDDIAIKYVPKNENISVKFVYYAKKGLDKDNGDNVVNYN